MPPLDDDLFLLELDDEVGVRTRLADDIGLIGPSEPSLKRLPSPGSRAFF